MNEVKGLRYIENFMSEYKEQKLIEYIDSNHWDNTLKRRTQQYGHRYVYNHVNSNNIEVQQIPKKFIRLFKKLRNSDIGTDIDLSKLQVIVNEYMPGGKMCVKFYK